MTRLREFRLPDLGEGLTEGEILSWRVKPGDEVALNQIIVEVETAKAAVEVPSPYAGVITEIHHAAGTTVDVGATIITVDTDPSAGPLEVAPTPADHLQTGEMVPLLPADPGPQGALIGEIGANGRTATLVGYGPRSVTAKRRPRVATREPAAPTPAPARVSALEVGATAAVRSGEVSVRAKPPVRKLAKDNGVDLTLLRGTGPDGTITRADVEAVMGGAAAHRVALLEHAARPGAGALPGTQDSAASLHSTARESRIPVRGVRKHMATAMVTSAFTAPHVTEFLTLDMTPTMELRERVQAMPEFAGVKVSPLLFVAKAVLLAVQRSPEINSSWDEDAQEIVVKDYVNLGIAAATPRGLLVPNIKDADLLSLPELARALQELTMTAREGRTAPSDMTGGTITITNVGAFGVDNGTPILNPGESAILCFGAVRQMPWVVDGQVVARSVTSLSLSFDHRTVDGQLGSQFLADIGRVLGDPATALVWG